jgi:glycosyltransferase involved in cell wall biosynthesis
MPPPSSPLGASSSLGLWSRESAHRLQFPVRSTLPEPKSPATDLDLASLPIIAFCHLSWSWVWQRPQQFLSRLARTHPLLFVETYCTDTPAAHAVLRTVPEHPNVTILETHLPSARWNDGAFIDAARRRVVREVLAGELRGKFDQSILWFYDPMAVTAFAGQLNERVIVYDCMDELSQFKGAPPELQRREIELLQAADVVFCGGRKMREKRLPVNPNCHFYGTGVDVAHFGSALSADLPVHPDVAELNPPVLGYFGVIDERIDYALLAKLADARPDWSIAMVGPFAKVDPKDFPQRPNLHWLGGRPYERLPEITKGFSVCLMPFALNPATEYINPTKALEYMAAGRPVVSSALNEVKSNFARVCHIAHSHEQFIEHCRREVERPSLVHIDRGLTLARENTWEAIASRMEQHIADALAARARAPRSTTDESVPYAFNRQRAAYV